MAALGASGLRSAGTGSGAKRKRQPLPCVETPDASRSTRSRYFGTLSPDKAATPGRPSTASTVGAMIDKGNTAAYGSGRQLKINSRGTWGGPATSRAAGRTVTAPARSLLAWSMADYQGEDRRRGIREGFRNSGNSCYVNAVLQVLMAQTLFSKDLMRNRLVSPSPGSFYSYVKDLVDTFKDKRHGVIDVKDLKDAIGTRYPRFAGNAQQDAHEFFSEFINHLNEDLCDSLKQQWQLDHPTLSLQEALASSSSASSSTASSGASTASVLAPIQLSGIPVSSSSPAQPSSADSQERLRDRRELQRRRAEARKAGTLTGVQLSEDIHKELTNLLETSPTSLNFKSQVCSSTSSLLLFFFFFLTFKHVA